MKSPRKVLIIKTGFSEFLDRGVSTTVSLGDVLICTSLLHLYKNDRVTWVTSWAARELLENNPYIHELLIFNSSIFPRLAKKEYDIVINLEKDIGICSFLSQLKTRRRFGFYFHPRKYDIATFKRSTQFLLAGQENHRDIDKAGYEILYDAVDHKWRGQGAILKMKSPQHNKYDVGFNYAVGSKWPTKAWPIEHWKKLEAILHPRYSVSWQKGHKNITRYVQWIDSCRLIVTSDSLGQVIGQALGKKVITLYGPTNPRRMQGVQDVSTVTSPLQCPYMPCYLDVCRHHTFCMDYIAPKTVAELCEDLLCEAAAGSMTGEAE